jgi:hypothetical protein
MTIKGVSIEGVVMMQHVVSRRNLVVVTAVIALLVSLVWIAVASSASAAPGAANANQPFLGKGPIEMTRSGTEWMARPVPPSSSTVPVVADRTSHSTVFTGDGWAVIGLTGPAAIGGTDYGLASFDLCLSGAGTPVVDVSAVAINYFVAPNVDDDDIRIDVTVQDGSVDRESGCYTYTVNTPVGQGIGLQVTLDGGAELFSVKSVWTTAAATG